MATDYRALHNQYAQGMAQQGTVQPNSQPGFNFLQGWSASPTAGFLPPKGPTQQPIQYGTPTTGGWIGGADGQPVGNSGGSQSWYVNGQDPRAMIFDGTSMNYTRWRDGTPTGPDDPRSWRNSGDMARYEAWRNGYDNQGAPVDRYAPQAVHDAYANRSSQQQSPLLGGNMQANFGMQQPGQLMPGFGATPMPKPQPNFGIPMPKPIVQYDQFGKPIRNDQTNPGRPIIPDYNWGP